MACRNGQLEKVKSEVQSGTDPKDLFGGWAAIHWAARMATVPLLDTFWSSVEWGWTIRLRRMGGRRSTGQLSLDKRTWSGC